MPLPLIPQVWGRMQICVVALARAFLSMVILLLMIPEYGAAFRISSSLIAARHVPQLSALSRRPAGVLSTMRKSGMNRHHFNFASTGSGKLSPRFVGLEMSLSTDSDATPTSGNEIATLDDLQNAANRIGMYFTMTWLGPVYRCVIRKLPEEGEEKGEAIGFTTGSMVGSLIRQDTMRISNVNSGNELSKKRPDEIADRGWKSPHVLGLGILLGAYPLRVAYDKGIQNSQLLAICDEPRQFKILRRHYMRMGLKPIKELTDDISCVPDRLIWGGTGTLMEADVKEILGRHTQELRNLGI